MGGWPGGLGLRRGWRGGGSGCLGIFGGLGEGGSLRRGVRLGEKEILLMMMMMMVIDMEIERARSGGQSGLAQVASPYYFN